MNDLKIREEMRQKKIDELTTLRTHILTKLAENYEKLKTLPIAECRLIVQDNQELVELLNSTEKALRIYNTPIL